MEVIIPKYDKVIFAKSGGLEQILNVFFHPWFPISNHETLHWIRFGHWKQKWHKCKM